MSVQPFTRGFEDKSNEEGYRFVFKCDICGAEYLSKYVEAESNKKRSYISIATRAFSLGESVLDTIPLKDRVDLTAVDENRSELAEELSRKYSGMSPKWHTGHDTAFQDAQTEAKNHFHYCQACKNWVCDRDWDDDKKVCTKDSQQKICPKCHKAVGSAKFCTFCGTAIQLVCSKCGKEYASGAKFCGECGSLLA